MIKFREIHTPLDAPIAIHKALKDGEYVNGPYIERVEEKMIEITKAEQAVAVGSGTIGLKIAIDAMGLKPGDMVIIPDVTFIACASVLLELNVIPIFVDVNENYILDEKSTVRAVAIHGENIKAIMAVRLGGEPIPEWVYGLGIPVLIDSAHSMDPLPEKALACVYSFHPSKIVSGVEGGCIVTNSAGDAEKMRRLRSFGFTKGTRIAQEVGYKGNMSNISAIVIWYNLLKLRSTLDSRIYIRDRFNASLGLQRQGLGMYLILHANPDLICEKVGGIRHYPMTLSEMVTGVPQTENAQRIVKHLVSIPFHEHLDTIDVDNMCAMIKSN